MGGEERRSRKPRVRSGSQPVPCRVCAGAQTTKIHDAEHRVIWVHCTLLHERHPRSQLAKFWYSSAEERRRTAATKACSQTF